MSTEDFWALREEWEMDAPRELGDWERDLRMRWVGVKEMREKLMFSAWVNSLRGGGEC